MSCEFMHSKWEIKILHTVNKKMDVSKKAKNVSASDHVKQYLAGVYTSMEISSSVHPATLL